MSCYRRRILPGATYFFTVNLAVRGQSLLTDQIDLLRQAYRDTIAENRVFCDAMVVLPDHLHAVWTLPPGDAGYSERWRRIKARFSHALGQEQGRSASKAAKRERGIWQRRFWEHVIRDDADYARHVTYCWGDPVHHGLVSQAQDWPFSTFHRDLRAGRVDAAWRPTPMQGRFGE
ncbi:transposase [Pseudorhodobacter sp. E13]|uniref:REP-associated tyrosine transposase n=1 Tax=Pseudorhodobacter sp. E13 TaxID=2487931 RepID=UPI000F8E6D80|nr:transposase [Pseudorhodobacter sp. E13]RUS60767.1 transposase [Pseudorhodobacter sp. E13]